MSKIALSNNSSREEKMAIRIGKAALELRTKLGLSLREAAIELGISYVHLCRIENGKASPSTELIERFHEKWGVDLYMYAVAFHSDDRKAPLPLRAPLKAMAEGWRRHIESLLRKRSKEGAEKCLISAD